MKKIYTVQVSNAAVYHKDLRRLTGGLSGVEDFLNRLPHTDGGTKFGPGVRHYEQPRWQLPSWKKTENQEEGTTKTKIVLVPWGDLGAGPESFAFLSKKGLRPVDVYEFLSFGQIHGDVVQSGAILFTHYPVGFQSVAWLIPFMHCAKIGKGEPISIQTVQGYGGAGWASGRRAFHVTTPLG